MYTCVNTHTVKHTHTDVNSSFWWFNSILYIKCQLTTTVLSGKDPNNNNNNNDKTYNKIKMQKRRGNKKVNKNS